MAVLKQRRLLVPGRGRGTTAAADSGSYDAKAVRAWARDNGITVNERGRIPATVLEQFAPIR